MQRYLRMSLLALGLVPCIAPFVARPARAAMSRPDCQIRWMNDLSSAFREARITGKPVMLCFDATWCPYSRRMERETYSDSQVAALSRGFICVKVDGDTAYGQALMRQYAVNAYPYVIFFERPGSISRTVEGFSTPRHFAEVMRELL